MNPSDRTFIIPVEGSYVLFVEREARGGKHQGRHTFPDWFLADFLAKDGGGAWFWRTVVGVAERISREIDQAERTRAVEPRLTVEIGAEAGGVA